MLAAPSFNGELIMKRISTFNPWRLLLAVLMFGTLSGVLVSCGDDDPTLDVAYYLNIQSTEAYKDSSTDQQQGTISQSAGTSVLYTSIMNMHEAIASSYPVRDNKGNDAAVIAACDEVFKSYLESQGEKDGPIICVVTLYRARMEGDIVRNSTPLKTYRFRSQSVTDVI